MVRVNISIRERGGVKLNHTQLNNLVISYQESRCEVTFSEIFERVSEFWKRNRVLHSLAKKYQLDFAEVESLANYTLYEIVDKYKDSGDFYRYLSTSLSRKCINLRRDSAKYLENELSLDASVASEDDSENPLIEFLVHANVEDEAIENLQRKSDQRQLIAHLLDKAPSKSLQAIEAYVETDFSYTQAAKLVGAKYDTVKRRVEKVASYYDANRSGSIKDYFTVATA